MTTQSTYSKSTNKGWSNSKYYLKLGRQSKPQPYKVNLPII